MNHYAAIQPPHPEGLWQYAQTSRRGGGPICGCPRDQGHATRTLAERHFYLTTVAGARPYVSIDPDVAHRCDQCGSWTPRSIVTGLYHLDRAPHRLCDVCVPDDVIADRWRARRLVRTLVPFVPGLESWGTF